MSEKCPACGAILPAMSLKCPDCGYVFSRESESSKELRDELKDLKDLLLGATNDQERATIIGTFSTPNTKAGLMNLLVFAANQFHAANGREEVVVSSAWLSKAKQAYSLLRLQSGGDKTTLEQLQQYAWLEDSKLKVVQSEAKRKRSKWIKTGLIALSAILVIYLFLLIVSNSGSENTPQDVRQAVMELIQEGRYDDARLKAAEAEYSWEQRELMEMIDKAVNEEKK